MIGTTGPVLQPVLALRGLRWLRTAALPWLALPLWACNLVIWHLAPLYDGVLTARRCTRFSTPASWASGCSCGCPSFGPLPKPSWWRNAAPLGYVVLVRLFSAAFGNVLIWSGSAFYGGYAAGEAAHGISPLSDQGIAGAIMMFEGGLVTLGVIVWLFLRAAREGEERQRLIDLADRAGHCARGGARGPRRGRRPGHPSCRAPRPWLLAAASWRGS